MKLGSLNGFLTVAGKAMGRWQRHPQIPLNKYELKHMIIVGNAGTPKAAKAAKPSVYIIMREQKREQQNK